MTAVYVALAFVLERRNRNTLVPYAFFVAWLVGIAYGYADAGIGNFANRNVGLWVAMTLSLVVLTLIPMGVTQALAAYSPMRKLGEYRWLAAGACAVVAIPLTNLASGALADRILPHIHR
jgi:hypothetical protein